MYYGSLTKLGKKAFSLSFSLLNKLQITTKESILLQQIEFVNNEMINKKEGWAEHSLNRAVGNYDIGSQINAREQNKQSISALH